MIGWRNASKVLVAKNAIMLNCVKACKVVTNITATACSMCQKLTLQVEIWAPLRKRFPATSIPSCLRASFHSFIIMLWTNNLRRDLFCFNKNFYSLRYQLQQGSFCMCLVLGMLWCIIDSLCAYPWIAENINPLLVYVFNDTKIMRRVKHKCGIHSPCIN